MDEVEVGQIDHIEECPQRLDSGAECKCEVNGVFCICVVCRRPYSKAEVRDMETCAECGVGIKPMLPNDNAKVSINWAELRMLAYWAEAYAVAYQQYPDMLKAVYAITQEIECQHPMKSPLTAGRELGIMKEKNPLLPIHGQVEPVPPKWRLQ